MRRIVRAFDRFLCRLQGVFVFWDDPDCLFRAQVTRASRTIVLPGKEVPAGAKVLGLHFWNEHMPQIPPEGPSLALAVRGRRMIVGTFRRLAREMHSDPRMDGVQALGGATVLFAAGDGSSGERLFTRLGYTVFPYQNPLGRFGEFWENFYTWALMWAYNAVSLRQRHLLALQRTESWITVDEFLRRYGTGEPQAQDGSERQQDQAPAPAKDPVRDTDHADQSRGP
jgi:hypothetical protein